MRMAEGETSGRKPAAPENRKAETQARILEAAVALFAELGFDGTSITAIASRAHVSRATVFWHFGDKASLFQEACRRILVPFIEELRNTLQHLDARKRLFELFNVYEQFVSSHKKTIETFVRWGLESHELRGQLQGGQDAAVGKDPWPLIPVENPVRWVMAGNHVFRPGRAPILRKHQHRRRRREHEPGDW